MTQVLEPTPVDEHPDAARAELERRRGYQSAVEATYWYMFAMLSLGLFAALWIFVGAQTTP